MYNPILTAIGKAKIADAIANNTTVNINKLAVGDGNGTHHIPVESQIALVNETYRTDISSITINPENPSLVEMVAVIPSNVGGFTIREVAVFDSDGDMIAVSDHPDFGKFIISGSANSLEIKFMIAVTNTDAITLVIQEDVYASAEVVQKIQNALKDSETPNGFPNRVDSKISFDEASRTFTIEPTTDKYSFYVEGIKFEKAGPLNVTISDINGLWFIYFDENGNLQTGQTSFFNVPASAYVAYVYWNSTQQKAVIFGDERHGLQIDKATHAYLHNFEGARYRNGLVAGDYTIVGTGNNDADAQFSLTNGSIQDEDIIHDITHSATPTNTYEQFLTPFVKAPVQYRDGTNGVWTTTTENDFAIKMNAGVPQYNQKSTGWALADVPNLNFYAVWILATNNIDKPIVAIVGQRVDATLEDAISNNKFSDLEFGDTALLEFKQLYRFIFQYNSTFTNQVKSALRNVIDVRGTTVRQISGTTTINHNELTGRSEANSHPIGAIGGVNSLTEKTTPVNADILPLGDSTSGFSFKKLTWANLKATLFNGGYSASTNGFIKLPSIMGGLIFQWGFIGGTSSSGTVTFPIAFPSSCFNVLTTLKNSNNVTTASTNSYTYTTTTFNYTRTQSSWEIVWFAIGY